MSITLTISRSGLKLSRNPEIEGVQPTINDTDLDQGKPDRASLEQFASKIRQFRRRKDKSDSDARQDSTADSAQKSISEVNHVHTIRPDHLEQLPEIPQSPLIISSTEGDRENTSKEPSVDKVTKSVLDGQIEQSDSTHPSQDALSKAPNIQPINKVDVDGGSNAQNNLQQDTARPLGAARPTATQALNLTGGTLNTSSKGKAPVQLPSSKTIPIHIPRTRLDRLRKIRVANSETIKDENVEFSPANKERLRNFLGVLRKKKDQIELFGKELPLCRTLLVQVTEGSAGPVPYICVQGLRNTADITRFHTVMSNKRYRPLYNPLKLCYDMTGISHVGYSEPATPQSSEYTTSGAEPGILGHTFGLDFLSPPPNFELLRSDPKPKQLAELNGQIQTFYQYRPAVGDKTYCGALSRTSIHGRPWVSTFGGLVEVNGMMCLISCQHGLVSPSVNYVPSITDTLVDKDIPLDVEGPLVFSSEDLPDGPDTLGGLDASDNPCRPSTPNSSPAIDTHKSSVQETEVEWEDLPVAGAIRMGREWCLVPIEEHSILPNFVERLKSKKGKDIGDPEIHYIEEASEPYAGCTAYMNTGVGGEFSGTLSANVSFLVGGGTEGFLEAWTMLFDKSQGTLQKGDSGSWVLDTSDPLRYKVLGATVAVSDGAAYFIRLFDQFHEITGISDKESPITLPSSFRTLVHCAHVAFKANDPSREWFLDQALSPRVLAQMCNVWYLPAIETLLKVDNGNNKPESSTKPLQAPVLRTLQGLLLRYGADLLDNIVNGEEWLINHIRDLSSFEIYTLRELFKAASPLRERELGRRENTFTPPLPLSAQKGRPLDLLRTVSPIQHQRHIQPYRYPGASLPQSQVEGTFGFLITRKTNSVASMFLLLVFPMVALSSLTGMLAALVLFAVEYLGFHTPLQIGVRRMLSLGSASGSITTSIWSLQFGIFFFVKNYNLRLYIGQGSTTLNDMVKVLAFTVLIVASSFARTILPALYVAKNFDLEDIQPIILPSIAAAAPMLVSTASPTISWYIWDTLRFTRKMTLYVIVTWLLTTGFDALAGYTFARMIQNKGYNPIHPASAATGIGVFGSFTIMWPILSCILFGPFLLPFILCYDRRVQIHDLFNTSHNIELALSPVGSNVSGLQEVGAELRNHQSPLGLKEPAPTINELPTDPPEHKPPESPSNYVKPPPAPTETFLQDLAEFLSNEPNYWLPRP